MTGDEHDDLLRSFYPPERVAETAARRYPLVREVRRRSLRCRLGWHDWQWMDVGALAEALGGMHRMQTFLSLGLIGKRCSRCLQVKYVQEDL